MGIIRTQTVETGANATEERPDLPLSHDPKTLLLLAIFVLLFLYALYLSSELIVPIIVAFMLSMALRPGMDFLTRLYIPKFAAGLVIVLMGAGCLIGTAYLLSGPTSAWLAKAPESLATLQIRLAGLVEVTDKIQKAGKEVEKINKDSQTPEVTEPRYALQPQPMPHLLSNAGRARAA